MNRLLARVVLLLSAIVSPLLQPAFAGEAKPLRRPAMPEECARAREAWRRIAAWYAEGGVKNDRRLFVTYFCPADRRPYPEYRERLDRILKDVRDFYADEMSANGLPPISFRLETDASGRLVIHDCAGDKPLSQYGKHTNAGSESRLASTVALKAAGIDLDRNHTLIVCQMPDGISPYYGGGGAKSGVCWICDLPGLDVSGLASPLTREATLKLAQNDEERKNFRGRTLADHTTVYIGGTAHELGHCFSLPHTGESPEQRALWGTSLMGGGNYAYGQERRGAGKGAFLNPTDALRLISQPLFTGVDKQVGVRGKAEFAGLVAAQAGDAVRVTGRVARAAIPVYAVLVTCLPDRPGGDYASNAVSSLVNPETGAFDATISRAHDGPVDLMLTALHMNGELTNLHARTTARGRRFDIGKLNREWAFAPVGRLYADGKDAEVLAGLDSVAAARAGDPAIAARVAAWRRALARPKPGVSPAVVPAGTRTVRLDALAALKETTGYGPAPASRGFIPSREFGPVPRLGGEDVPHALFAHAPGGFVFELGGAWKQLTGAYGVQSGAHGSVALQIRGDGKVLFAGAAVTLAANHGRGPDKTRPVPFAVDVTGVKVLELRLTDAGDGPGGDWGLIANPTLTR